ncbi:MAG: flavodoxin [Acidimicrobiales bacterium]
MDQKMKPSVLFVYYSYTNQTKRVLDAMADALQSQGCDVTFALIEFTDPRYQKRFKDFPMPRPFREVVSMIPSELRDKPVRIEIPDAVTQREYDLVVVGAPTWWLSTDAPMRTFMESEAAAIALKGKEFTAVICCRRYWKHNLKTVKRKGIRQGGTFVEGIHFRYQGGQVRSLFSLLSYLGTGEYKEKYHGVRIPPTNIQEYHLKEARTFAGKLASHLTD